MTPSRKKRIIHRIIYVAIILVVAFAIWYANDRKPDQKTDSTSTQQTSQVQDDSQSGNHVVSNPADDEDLTTANDTSFNTADESQKKEAIYTFRNKYLRDEHFKKHRKEFDYNSAEEYEKGASAVVNSQDALHKTEKDDGDDIYYIEKTNELVIVSTKGYIRTYFKPDSGKKYYDKQ